MQQAPGHPLRFLAFDTSTDRLSVGVSDGARTWLHEGAGGAQASTSLIPLAMDLLAQAGLQLQQLDAIAFGRGPGSFTGLRTACSVAQGLALGAGVPVLPVDSLLALAEEARFKLESSVQAHEAMRITALLDARMDEIYVQDFALTNPRHDEDKTQSQQLTALAPCRLLRPEALAAALAEPLAVPHAMDDARRAMHEAPHTHCLAGNVFEVYAGRLPDWHDAPAQQTVHALPTAAALLRLAPALWVAGQAVPAAQALPLYVRDKVALTTAERAQAKLDASLQAQHAKALSE